MIRSHATRGVGFPGPFSVSAAGMDIGRARPYASPRHYNGEPLMTGIPVLVTGGAGYIGAHACKALARAGYLPVTYDSLVTGHRAAVKFGPFEEGDLAFRAKNAAKVLSRSFDKHPRKPSFIAGDEGLP